MRLIAVPLARARPASHPISTFVAQTASRAAEKAAADAAAKQKDGSNQSKLPFTTRMLNKASAFWIDLGRTDQKSTFEWKRRTYVLGERLMDRIEYQEWALKGIDPAMGPHLMSGRPKDAVAETSDSGIPKLDHIPLLYPPSLLQPERLLKSLKNLTDHRTPHHYRRFWYCVVGMPITIPFALVRKYHISGQTGHETPLSLMHSCRSETELTLLFFAFHPCSRRSKSAILLPRLPSMESLERYVTQTLSSISRRWAKLTSKL